MTEAAGRDSVKSSRVCARRGTAYFNFRNKPVPVKNGQKQYSEYKTNNTYRSRPSGDSSHRSDHPMFPDVKQEPSALSARLQDQVYSAY